MRQLTIRRMMPAAIVALLGVACAAAGFNLSVPAVPPVEVSPLSAPPLSLEQWQAGFVTFTLNNTGSQDVHVLGSNDSCDPEMCIGLSRACPFVLPARTTTELKVRVAARNIGTFERVLDLYTDCPEQPEIRLRASVSATPAVK